MHKPIDALRPHSLNAQMYGEEEVAAEFVENIRGQGVLEPLAVKQDGTIISGHRRWRAARAAGMATVPVQIVSYADDLAEREALIGFNRQREKTFSQKMAEAEQLEAIERERAEQRRLANLKRGDQKPEVETLPPREGGKTRDKVAAATGIGSGRTYDKAAQVWEAAKAGDEVAQRAVEKLDKGTTTINRAHKNLTRRAQTLKHERDRADKAPGTMAIHHVDGLGFLERVPEQSFDLLLTDPPYMTEVDDVAEFARRWVPLALSRVKPSGRAYIFVGAYPDELHAYLSVLLEQGLFTLDNVLSWTYRNVIGPSPTHGYRLNWQACLYLYGPKAAPLDCASLVEQFAVHDINAPDGRLGNRHHTWQKPDELAERFIRHSTKEGDAVLDPFAGTGTFILAAARLGRHGVGCEIDPEMLCIAEKRGAVVRRAG